MVVGRVSRGLVVAFSLLALVALPVGRADPTDPTCVQFTTGADANGLPSVTPIVDTSEFGFVVAGNLVVTSLYFSMIVHPGFCAGGPGDGGGPGPGPNPTGPAGPP
ncbi:MAG: hypothetical protein ACYDCK_15470 [Thermoplasmatota archaeon]